MNASDDRLLGYVELAALARECGQPDDHVRFLILAGVEACRTGLAEVAERCQLEIVRANPRHLVTQYDSFADALRDPDFEPFLRSLERRYPWEQSEHVLAELGIPVDATDRDALLKRVDAVLPDP